MRIATFYDHILDIARQQQISVIEALKYARELGVEAVEVSANNLLGREDELGQELAMTDLEISAVPGYFDFGRDFDVERQALPLLEACGYLGASKLLVIPGFIDETVSQDQRQAEMETMVEGVNRLADLAISHGIHLVMENFDDTRAPFSTCQGVRRFLDECPGLSCAFDSGNFRFAGEDLLEAYQVLKDRIEHVHLKDRAYSQSNGEEPKVAVDGVSLYPAPVGSGVLPLKELVDLLKRDGYDGIYTIEHYGSNMALEYLQKSIAWVKEHLGEK